MENQAPDSIAPTQGAPIKKLPSLKIEPEVHTDNPFYNQMQYKHLRESIHKNNLIKLKQKEKLSSVSTRPLMIRSFKINKSPETVTS